MFDFAKLVDSRASYSPSHVAKTLLLISKNPVGRFTLMEELGLGEASVKTLLKNLSDAGLTKTSGEGQSLSKKGAGIVKSLESRINGPVEIDAKGYAIENHNVAVVVKKCAEKIKSGVEQRDEAIKSGALGATTLVCEKGRLKFPTMDKKIEVLENILRNVFEIENGDVVIIASAETHSKSGNAALAAALSLI